LCNKKVTVTFSKTKIKIILFLLSSTTKIKLIRIKHKYYSVNYQQLLSQINPRMHWWNRSKSQKNMFGFNWFTKIRENYSS